MTKEKRIKNNDLRCLKMQKNGALRKKPSSESCGDTWWMIWKQMGCKTVKDKSTTLVDKLKKDRPEKHQILKVSALRKLTPVDVMTCFKIGKRGRMCGKL